MNASELQARVEALQSLMASVLRHSEQREAVLDELEQISHSPKQKGLLTWWRLRLAPPTDENMRALLDLQKGLAGLFAD